MAVIGSMIDDPELLQTFTTVDRIVTFFFLAELVTNMVLAPLRLRRR